MKTRRRKNATLLHRRSRRRGVTLVEMLVTLAVLLLMMALVVQIFQAATGSMNAAQVYQRIDDDLRRFDSTIRGDLSGATAKFTPPLNPADDKGYFEYVENEFADNDLEDCDDSIRLTVKAPDDRPFIGRMWAKPPKVLIGNNIVQLSVADMTPAQRTAYFASQPITVSSKHAEVMYFLRNGNLYRRVLLIAPELQSSIVHTYSGFGAGANVGTFPGSSGGGSIEGPLSTGSQYAFTPGALGGYKTSWQGVNDLSAHPAPRGNPLNYQFNSVILNRLGDLTDRHKRFASPRWADDFIDLSGTFNNPDGTSDDLNNDSVPDWYPTLSASVIQDAFTGPTNTIGLWNPIDPGGTFTASYLGFSATQAFPFIYRGAYSTAQNLGGDSWRGWIHAPAPYATDGGTTFRYYQAEYLKFLNHNPLDLGDNLPAPRNGGVRSSNLQTYWGLPTWRETLAPEWTDPTFQVNQAGGASFPFGLAPVSGAEMTAGYLDQTGAAGQQLLPPMTSDWRGPKFDPFSDGAGANTALFSGNTDLWTKASWEDDLILTNVRSFDVKAFEPALADYADLGWGDDPRITAAATSTIPGTTTPALPYLGTGHPKGLPYDQGSLDAYTGTISSNPYAFIHGRAWQVINQTFAHEGRMPPIWEDLRFDAQYGEVPMGTYPSSIFGRNFSKYNGNIGDESSTTVRMRRTWDSWSTTYSKAIGTGVVPGATGGFPYGPPSTPPIYPSYPAPYPAPLRGIQIQVRVTDPTNQRIKVLTIRQDFTDKL